jgi:hypothetical protein
MTIQEDVVAQAEQAVRKSRPRSRRPVCSTADVVRVRYLPPSATTSALLAGAVTPRFGAARPAATCRSAASPTRACGSRSRWTPSAAPGDPATTPASPLERRAAWSDTGRLHQECELMETFHSLWDAVLARRDERRRRSKLRREIPRLPDSRRAGRAPRDPRQVRHDDRRTSWPAVSSAAVRELPARTLGPGLGRDRPRPCPGTTDRSPLAPGGCRRTSGTRTASRAVERANAGRRATSRSILGGGLVRPPGPSLTVIAVTIHLRPLGRLVGGVVRRRAAARRAAGAVRGDARRPRPEPGVLVAALAVQAVPSASRRRWVCHPGRQVLLLGRWCCSVAATSVANPTVVALIPRIGGEEYANRAYGWWSSIGPAGFLVRGPATAPAALRGEPYGVRSALPGRITKRSYVALRGRRPRLPCGHQARPEVDSAAGPGTAGCRGSGWTGLAVQRRTIRC